MSISIKDVEHVAKLARLEFSSEEMNDFTEKLNSVVEYVEKLKEVDVEGVEPTYHALPIKNVFREDEVRPSYDREKILMNAPEKKDGCFKVPRVVE